MWRRLIPIAVSLTLIPASISLAALVQSREWAESEIAKLYPKLVCDWEMTIQCSGTAISCQPPHEADYPSLLIDLNNRTIDFAPGDPRPYQFVSGSIDDRGYDGNVALTFAGKPFKLNFLEPKAASTKIRFAFTVDDQGEVQIQTGSCHRSE